MPDLAIRGGRVVTADGVIDADIHVLGGVVTAIAPRDRGDARAEIDARGLVVLPGVVDAHVHVNEPGRTEWEGWLAATRGAAAGGTTTIADMPLNSIPPTIDGDAFDTKYDAASANAVVDFAMWGGLVGVDADTLRDLAECGVVGVKAFMCPSGVDEFPHVTDADLEPALRAATNAGLLVAAHCEDEHVLERARGQVRGRDLASWLSSRPLEAERAAIKRFADGAMRARARVHVVHVSAMEALDAVAEARRSGVDITAETCPHYLAFDVADFDRLGPLIKCAPPIRDAARDALWERVTSGRVEYVASDHSPCTAELKMRGRADVFEAWGGVSGVQSMLAVMLTHGLHERAMPLALLAQLLSTRPAKRLGIWPRKGEIRVGSDADFAFVDLDREWTLTHEQLQTRSGLSPYVGRRFHGSVTRTIVRGRTVYADGQVTGTPGDGWFVQRINS